MDCPLLQVTDSSNAKPLWLFVRGNLMQIFTPSLQKADLPVSYTIHTLSILKLYLSYT